MKILAILLMSCTLLGLTGCITINAPTQPPTSAPTTKSVATQATPVPKPQEDTPEPLPELFMVFDASGLSEVDTDLYTLDGIIFFKLDQSGYTEYGEENVMALLTSLEEDTYDMSCFLDDELSQATTYPTWYSAYYSGYNEDTLFCVDAVVQTDTATLRLHIYTSADFFSEYEEEIAWRISTIGVVE